MLWSIASPTRKTTYMNGWLKKTPRPEPATKHERRTRRKAGEAACEVAHPVMKLRPLSGLHTIPRKGREGAQPTANQRIKPTGSERPKPPVGLPRKPRTQGPGKRRTGPVTRPQNAREEKRSRAPPPEGKQPDPSGSGRGHDTKGENTPTPNQCREGTSATPTGTQPPGPRVKRLEKNGTPARNRTSVKPARSRGPPSSSGGKKDQKRSTN